MEGIDSREIIISVFNKCRELEAEGHPVRSLFIGAMGTNGLSFPYEVALSEILNCYVYAQRLGTDPRNLYFSMRSVDMTRAGLTVEEILSYITTIVKFFRN